MEHFPIKPETSSQLKWSRYDPVHQLLWVDFKNKDGDYQSTYEYGSVAVPVTRQFWEDFRASPRPGVFFAERIRGKFPYRKLAKRQEHEAPAEQEKLF